MRLNANKGYMLADLISAYQAVGFVACGMDQTVEFGFEKVALYQCIIGKWTHAARLRPDGWWESKLGDWDDILHATAHCLEGRGYGTIALCMKRTLVASARERWKARARARTNGKW